MVAEPPKVCLTGRYSVTETCKLLGIHRNTLLNYTRSGIIRAGLRKSTRRKFYLGSEIMRVWNNYI